MKEFDAELKELKKKNLLRKLTCIELSHGTKVSINGQTFLNYSSNDYLGLSKHPEIIKAAISAMKKYGFGSGASRLLSGTYLPHVKLEERIASFKKTEAAIVFNTGYAANTGVIPAITGDKDVIFSDELNHASIIDGVRLSKAGVKVYRHRDVNHLETLLEKNIKGKVSGECLVITDTVFSMDGDIAPLKYIISLCEKYNAILMIDDAHGTGILGGHGKGGLEHFNIKSDRVIQMGTFSKALGCFGAFVCGPKELINLLISKARSFIYSTSLPPAVAAAATKAIDIVEFESEKRRRKLWKNRQRLHEGLMKLGYDTVNSETPIIPVLTGDLSEALRVSKYLFDNKIFAPAIRPPSVPEGKCRIRFTVTAAHVNEDIDNLLGIMSKLGDEKKGDK